MSMNQVVVCDGCGKAAPPALESEDARQLSLEAGWSWGVGMDFCPECIKVGDDVRNRCAASQTMGKVKTVSAMQTHEGKALECFGFSENEGGVTFMRWIQTPYQELATPPELFDLSMKEWRDLREEIGEHYLDKAVMRGTAT